MQLTTMSIMLSFSKSGTKKTNSTIIQRACPTMMQHLSESLYEHVYGHL